jgi:hypothetical protein
MQLQNYSAGRQSHRKPASVNLAPLGGRKPETGTWSSKPLNGKSSEYFSLASAASLSDRGTGKKSKMDTARRDAMRMSVSLEPAPDRESC